MNPPPPMANFKTKHPFQSARLVYRGLENNDDDKIWYDEVIRKDAPAFTLNNGNLLRPQRRDMSDDAFEGCLDDTLAVMICLPDSSDTVADAKTAAATNSINDCHKSGDTTAEYCKTAAIEFQNPTKRTPDHTRIGILTLDAESGGDFGYMHHHRNMWLCITLVESNRNQGFGREALNSVLD